MPRQVQGLPLLRKLSRLLHDVPQKPTPEPVHRLRTTVRRIEALLDSLPEDNHDKLRRELRRLRRLAGSVRDLDIQQALLKRVRADGHPEQKEAVALKLAKKRGKREKKLVSRLDGETVASLRKRLRRLAEELRRRPAEAQGGVLEDPVRAALNQFAELSSEAGLLTPESLHGFRTRTKRIRYLAELGCSLPDGELVVRELKRVQDAIGVWHDWSELLRLSAKVLADKPHAMLLGVLRTNMTSQYSLALRTVRDASESLRAIRASRTKRGPRSAGTVAETRRAAG